MIHAARSITPHVYRPKILSLIGVMVFGWFASSDCPVDETTRAWVEKRMAWVAKTFGPHRMREAKIILPTPEFFPDTYDASPAAGKRLFGRVCAYAGVDVSRVELRWMAGRPDARIGPSFIQADGGAAGTYQAGGHWREVITLDTANLREPMQLVATSAHELCHVHLLGDGKVDRAEEDHEPLTDLLTVCLGLGIFGANAAFNDKAWSDARMHGWSVSRLGYLSQPTWAYALAVFAWVRGEESPSWTKHLRPDIRSGFKASMRYLHRVGVGERSLLD